MNVLNTEFDTPYNSAPFSKIKTTHFLPAFKTALTESKKNIAAIDARAKTITAPIMVSFFVGQVILKVSCLTS